MEGLRRFIAERARRVKIEPGQREALEEKEVLKLAQIEQGIVTPALVALKTNLTADRAEKILQNLAKRGFTLMQVTEDGRVEYEFPEFKPRIESSPG
jgi:ribosomal protein S25